MSLGKAVAFAFFVGASFSISAATSMKFDWHHTDFSANGQSATDVAIDSNGNIFWGYTRPKLPLGSGTAYALQKFSGDGTLIWTREMDATIGPVDPISRIAADVNGNTAIFQGGPFSYTYYNGVPYYAWHGGFAKVTSGGVVAFSTLGTQTVVWGYSVEPFRAAAAIDGAGNCIFGFPYNDFAWGTQIFRSSDQKGEAGVLKVSSDGGFAWFKKVIGPGFNSVTGLAVDSASNIYAAGFGEGEMAFDATILGSNGGRDGFVAKYDKDGALIWVKRPICGSDDIITCITLAADGTLWFAGTYRDTLTFGSSVVSGGAYLAHMDSNGTAISVAKLSGVAEVAKVASSESVVVATGRFLGNTLFGTSVSAQGSNDVFVAELNGDGAARWVKTFGYFYSDVPGGVAVAGPGEVIVAAQVDAGVVLDGQFISGSDSQDVLLAKISASPSSTPVITSQPRSTVVSGGMNIELNVAAVGSPPLTYQWWFDGAPLTGKTSPSLVLANVRPENAGSYFVVAKNSAGETQSEIANVSYTDAGSLQLSVHPSLTIFGTVGRTYRIDYAVETRSPAVWTTVANISLPAAPYVWQDTNAAIADKRFYRVLLRP